MPSFLGAKWKDYADQTSSIRLRVRSIDENNINTIQTEFSALRSAMDAYTLGNLQTYEIIADRVFVSQGRAGSPSARRELKLLLTYEDSVTHRTFDTELPMPDTTVAALWDTQGFADTSTAQWTALKAAFEATVQSVEGNPVILQSGEIVGRNI